MYEPWVKKINLSAINFPFTDHGHPNIEKLGKNSTKQACTGITMIKIIQSVDVCFSGMYTYYVYLGDKPLEGTWPIFLITIII